MIRTTITLLFVAILIPLFGQENVDSLRADQVVEMEAPVEEPMLAIESFTTSAQGKDMFIHAGSLNGKGQMLFGEDTLTLDFLAGKAKVDMAAYDRKGKLLKVAPAGADAAYKYLHISKKKNGNSRVRSIPLWLSILPPLVAIFLALIFKEVILSLFVGIWTGAFIAGGLRIESIYYFFTSVVEVVSKYIMNALNNWGHLAVIVFSLLIGGMVAIISKNGGMAGVVKSLSKYARSPRSTQFITWLLGVAIFFDDYANTLIVGNTMRSLTDKFKISREKLAYIVDSTAAPVSAIAFITTWIGAELGFIDSGLTMISGPMAEMTPYAIFLASLKYSFYPILTLIFMLFIIYTKKDFGPMHKAELRARSTGQVSPARTKSEDEPDMEDLSPVSGASHKWHNAAIPVLTVIFMTIFGLIDTGMSASYSALADAGNVVDSESWGTVWSQLGLLGGEGSTGFFGKLGILIGNADSYTALLWASLFGVIVAVIMTVSSKIMSLFDTMHWMTTGFKTMLPALIILTLAWSLALCTEELGTAEFLSSALGDSINPAFMPAIIFILAALIAFSTGSSWSTMAILYPIAIPTTWAICQATNLDPAHSTEILYNVIATVLAASVLGDHCSPISDTTILSSLACDCNHIAHVQTQLPYALTVGGFSLVSVTLAAFFGGGFMLSLLLIAASLACLYLIVRKFGKVSEVGG